jgi:hypothetical protein
MAQDPVKVDPAHYKMEFENAYARVLRIRYAPRERSVMHGHPTGLGVHLTDGHARFTFPNGKIEELRFRAGEVRAYPAGPHLPENLGDQPLELVFRGAEGPTGSEEAGTESRGEEAGDEEGDQT